MADNSRYVFDWLVNKGYKPHAAAALVGHATQESGVRPNGVTGDNGTAHGMFQWRGTRFTGLKNFAAAQGTNWRDIDTQLGFLDHELNTTEKFAGDKLRASTNVREATRAGMHFERPQGYTRANPEGGHGWNNRFNVAQGMATQPATAVADMQNKAPSRVASAFGAPGDGRAAMAPKPPMGFEGLGSAPGVAPTGLAAAFGPNPMADSAPATEAPKVGVAELFGAPRSQVAELARPDTAVAGIPAAPGGVAGMFGGAQGMQMQMAMNEPPATPPPIEAPVIPDSASTTGGVAGETGGMPGLGGLLAGLMQGGQQAVASNPRLGQIAASLFTPGDGGDDFEKTQAARAAADKRRRQLAFGQPLGQMFA